MEEAVGGGYAQASASSSSAEPEKKNVKPNPSQDDEEMRKIVEEDEEGNEESDGLKKEKKLKKKDLKSYTGVVPRCVDCISGNVNHYPEEVEIDVFSDGKGVMRRGTKVVSVEFAIEENDAINRLHEGNNVKITVYNNFQITASISHGDQKGGQRYIRGKIDEQGDIEAAVTENERGPIAKPVPDGFAVSLKLRKFSDQTEDQGIRAAEEKLQSKITLLEIELVRPSPADQGDSKSWMRKHKIQQEMAGLRTRKEFFNIYHQLKRSTTDKRENVTRYYDGLAALWKSMDNLSGLTDNKQTNRESEPILESELLALMSELNLAREYVEPTSDVITVFLPSGEPVAAFEYEETLVVKSLKIQLADYLGNLHVQRELAPQFHHLLFNGVTLGDDDQIGNVDGLEVGAELTLMLQYFCETCVGLCNCETCHHARQGRMPRGHTRHYFRYQTENGYKACADCGYCKFCQGKCKCSLCHGNGSSRRPGCTECGVYYDPCWGGGTRAILPDGSTKFIRDVRIGDTLRTVKGYRRVAAIWSGPHIKGRTEVCNFQGVWITSHHPVIVGRRWVFPADVSTSYPLHEKQHLVGDLFNFELEGHDDTLLLKPEDSENIIVTCTLGKYLGPRFGINCCTRRSIRCSSDCAQCDAVYIQGLDFGRIDPDIRWKEFPRYPQVEWDQDEKTEFDYAAKVVGENPHPYRSMLDSQKACPEPAWRKAILTGLEERVSTGMQRLTRGGLKNMLSAHNTYNAGGSSSKATCTADFGSEHQTGAVPCRQGACGICLGDGEVYRVCSGCDGWYCHGCLARHAKNTTAKYPYAMPLIACPGCDLRVSSSTWRAIRLEPSSQKAETLLSAKCCCCDSRSSAFVPDSEVLTDPCDRSRLSANLFSDEAAALAIWRAYQAARISPRDALEQLIPSLLAPKESAGRRQQVMQMLSLVVDVERRMGLSLALLDVSPELPCHKCDKQVCLRCRCEAHSGECPPQPASVATCPSCGAGAAVSANHNMILCVCGKYWEHDGAKPQTCDDADDLVDEDLQNHGAVKHKSPPVISKPIKWDVERMAAFKRFGYSRAVVCQ